MNPILFGFPRHTDQRGCLSVVESNRSVPFTIKRAFWLYDVPKTATRGDHAHKACEQVLIAVAGSMRVAYNEHLVLLDSPDVGLYAPPDVHLTLSEFSPGAVCLVLCSHYYDEEDYLDTVC